MRLEKSVKKVFEKNSNKPDVKVINKSQMERMSRTIRPQKVRVQTLELPYFEKTDNFK